MKLSPDQISQIDEARTAEATTRRPVSAGVEAVLHEAYPVLDQGFVRVVDYMGDDSAVVQAARVSYGRGTRRTSEDRGLIRYLMSHRHSTPFEMAEIKLHVKLPIFVARQWIRHRTASVNEYSARYSVLDKEFYIPSEEHLAIQSTTNRQGRGENIKGEDANRILQLLTSNSNKAYDDYLLLLNEDESGAILDESKDGLARELARMNLSLNYYTQWYWKIDLHNLLSFLQLRVDSHAQYEIRAYAEVILDIVKKWVPLSYEAFVDYRLNAVSLSSQAATTLRRIISGEAVDKDSSGLSVREWDELSKRFLE